MLKKALLIVGLLVSVTAFAQKDYVPTTENLKAREWFQNAKFGLFIHWGVYSVLGEGEWVMNNKGIDKKTYQKLQISLIRLNTTPKHGLLWRKMPE